MKNKKMIYVLLPVVLLIWGYIAFSIFTYGEDEDIIEPIRIDEIITRNQQKPKKKTLALNYADPFLKGAYNGGFNNNIVKKLPEKLSEKVIPVNWGSIIYNGFVKNQKSEKKIALLNVDGKQVLAGISDQVKELSIISIQQDSVLLKKENSQKWFVKFKKQ